MGPSGINPLLWLLGVTLVVRALRERREGILVAPGQMGFFMIRVDCPHILRAINPDHGNGDASRSNHRVNHPRALSARHAPGSHGTPLGPGPTGIPGGVSDGS